MTDWEKVTRISRGALQRDPAERDAYLDEACAGDPTLREQLGAIFKPDRPDDTSEWLFGGLKRLMEELTSTTPIDWDDEVEPSTAQEGPNTFFKSSPFTSLGRHAVADLLASMALREYAAGDRLISQGDPAEFLLLILTGRAVARVRDVPGDRPPIGEFGPGDIVGEMSLITDEPRTADVIARTDVRALSLGSADFHVLANRHPELRVVLTEVMADRLGHARYDGLGGKAIHGYEIVQCVGRGGMGVVYEARHLASGRRVALKMMNHRMTYQPTALRRFRREAAILKSLSHPALARLYETFSAFKTEFLAMEFCEGSTLKDVIAARGPLDESEVRRVVGQLAAALHYVHESGIVHRDIKPSNVMVTKSGAIKLLDFGIVTFDQASDLWQLVESGSKSQTAVMLGTPRYMAPEQFSERPIDRRADFYGLACVAFEALSGHAVIEATDVFTIIREQAQFVLPTRAEIGRGVSDELYGVIARGLALDPEARTLDLEQLAAWVGPVAGIEKPGDA